MLCAQCNEIILICIPNDLSNVTIREYSCSSLEATAATGCDFCIIILNVTRKEMQENPRYQLKCIVCRFSSSKPSISINYQRGGEVHNYYLEGGIDGLYAEPGNVHRQPLLYAFTSKH